MPKATWTSKDRTQSSWPLRPPPPLQEAAGWVQTLKQEPGSPMTGRWVGQSGQAQRLPGNRLRGEKGLRIRARGGWLQGLLAKIQDTKCFCPASVNIPRSQKQGAGVEHVLHTGQKLGGSTKGWESAQSGDVSRLPHDGVWHQPQGAHKHHQAPRRPQSRIQRACGYALALPAHPERPEPQFPHPQQ